LSVKTRIALMCGALFLVSGTTLICMNYFFVRAALPAAVEIVDNGQSTGTAGSEAGSPEAAGPAGGGRGIPDQYRTSVLRTMVVQSSLALGLTLALALFLGWIVASRVLRPVQQVASAARRLSADSLDQRINMEGPRDELTELADTFDGMLDRLASSFDSQRRFVANASHELRTPLAAQRTLVEVAMARPTADDSVKELGDRLLTMNVRIESLIEGMLVLARSDRGLDAKRPVRLDQVAETLIAAYRPIADKLGIELHYTLAPRLVHGDPVLLEQLITNLVDNAGKYNRSGGQVWIQVGEEPALLVRNTGPDVPNDALPTLFEPFRQLRRTPTHVNRGVGLGLSIVASIVRAHGGWVQARSREGGGLDMSVWFPPLSTPTSMN
jgi:signal transduction histidine kinase